MKRRREEAERKAAKAKIAAAVPEKPPELEYAKKYVSTIRTRFEHSPKMYQEFLNILQVIPSANPQKLRTLFF